MVQDTHIDTLKSAAGKARQSLDSISELLSHAETMSKSGKIDSDVLTKTQKQALLDSFAVKKFHRDYKEWEHAKKQQFIQNQVKPYNQKYAEMSRVYTDYEASAAALEDVTRNIRIPAFSFSIQTIQKFDNGSLLERVAKNTDGNFPEKVSVNQLFSLDTDSNLPAPSFAVFNRLVNLEFRLRLLMHIKYETLVKAKTNLLAKNRQWAARDTSLNNFFTRDFVSVYENVKKIKTSEYEDLKFYDEDEDSEIDEQEDENENDDEMEENEENAEKEEDDDDVVVEEEEEEEEESNQSTPGRDLPENAENTESDNKEHKSETPENGNSHEKTDPSDEMEVEDRADGDDGTNGVDSLESKEGQSETEISDEKTTTIEDNATEDMELD